MKNYAKFILKKLFYQNVSVLLIFCIDIINPVISSPQIACDTMCIQYLNH